MNKLTPRAPTAEMVEAERVKFEAWCAANGHGTLDDMMMPLDRSLKRLLWTAWQARAMHDAAPTVEAEPVAFVDAGELRNIGVGGFEPTISKSPVSKWDVPLYTHPAAPQPGALPGLSDAEIDRLWDESANIPIGKGWTVEETRYHYLARAVIAALKGKQ